MSTEESKTEKAGEGKYLLSASEFPAGSTLSPGGEETSGASRRSRDERRSTGSRRSAGSRSSRWSRSASGASRTDGKMKRWEKVQMREKKLQKLRRPGSQRCLSIALSIFTVLAGGVCLILLVFALFSQFSFMGATFSYMPAARPVPYMLVGSAFVFAVAMIVGVGYMRNKKSPRALLLLQVYAACLLLTEVLLLATCGYLVAHGEIAEGFVEQFKVAVETYASGGARGKVDVLQGGAGCCGVEGKADWKGKEPDSCCKVSGCDVKKADSIFTQGCSEKAANFANSSKWIIFAVCLTVAFIIAPGCTIGFLLAKKVRKKRRLLEVEKEENNTVAPDKVSRQASSPTNKD